MKLRVDPLAVLMAAVLFYLDREGIFPLFLLAAALHEAAHLGALALCGRQYLQNAVITLSVFGSEIKTGWAAPAHEALSIAAGPLANLFSAAAVCIASRFTMVSERLLVYAGISLMLGLYNCLPVVCLDGGRLLRLTLETRCLPDKAHRLSMGVSLTVCLCLAAMGLVLSWKFGAGFGLIIVSSWLLSKHLSCNKAENVLK